jgi:hypothetical protein
MWYAAERLVSPGISYLPGIFSIHGSLGTGTYWRSIPFPKIPWRWNPNNFWFWLACGSVESYVWISRRDHSTWSKRAITPWTRWLVGIHIRTWRLVYSPDSGFRTSAWLESRLSEVRPYLCIRPMFDWLTFIMKQWPLNLPMDHTAMNCLVPSNQAK